MLPPQVVVLERGWLSSNSIVVLGQTQAAVVDSGYCTHAEQTVALIARVVGPLPLCTLVNTHLHSDHCGGNAALQAQHRSLRTLIPPGLADAVRSWDRVALSHEPTGQSCPRFGFHDVLGVGGKVRLGDLEWEVHAAPGHDVHSVVLFEPKSRTLLSADALWANGFGVVFPEIEGAGAFTEVGDTLDLIESLQPRVVVPGHGSPFTDVGAALVRARSRLASHVAEPRRHASHAAKVLLKFKLLEVQRVPLDSLLDWAERTPYFRLLHDTWFGDVTTQEWLLSLIGELVRAGAACKGTDFLANAG